jgi:hypothetical protein
VRFACPSCDYPGGRLDLPGEAAWACPQCEHVVRPAVACPPPTLPCCALCGNAELFRKKDFPHGLGLGLLTLACVASTVTYYLYAQWLTWAILIGSALFDAVLYLCVGDVVECYRCGARHRGGDPKAEHPPFELTVYERYRQERIRREQMAAEARQAAGAPDGARRA